MLEKFTQVAQLPELSTKLVQDGYAYGLVYAVDDHAGRIVDRFKKAAGKPTSLAILKQPDGENYAAKLCVKSLPVLMTYSTEGEVIDLEAYDTLEAVLRFIDEELVDEPS